jgi:FUN14 domain-containing protein 1
MSGQTPDAVAEFLERSKVAAPAVGFGGVLGYCSGMAFRKAGKVAGVVIGLGFIGVQTAASSGYLEVNWEKVKQDTFIKRLDLNKDGKVDMDDAQLHWKTYSAMMTDKVPNAGGFAAGFLLGARRG